MSDIYILIGIFVAVLLLMRVFPGKGGVPPC